MNNSFDDHQCEDLYTSDTYDDRPPEEVVEKMLRGLKWALAILLPLLATAQIGLWYFKN